MKDDILLGIDLGGTKIECAALDVVGSVIWRRRLPTPRGDYLNTLAAIAELVRQAELALDLGGRSNNLPVGVGIPGSVSPVSGLVRNANSTVLNGKPFVHDLEYLLNRRVRVRNDANCLAVSEAVDGAGQGASMVVSVILGTGVGAGIAVDGREWLGANAIAGEWGHNPLPWPRLAAAWRELPGPSCWCGQEGCIETWLSGHGLAMDYAAHSGEQLAAPLIVGAMRAGDAVARASVIRYCDRLARALAHVINLLDPEIIVLGGGMSNVTELYAEVPRRWGRWVFSDVVRTRLVPALHGDSSGVRGAAWLWRHG
ncbi:MAG: ROK family protein [Proteobacteria bacterium]|nr:ROK family protein [Pseudomonadota bacterium]